MSDMYMAVSGLPDPCTEHARCIGRLALDMLDCVKHFKDPDGNPVQVTPIFPLPAHRCYSNDCLVFGDTQFLWLVESEQK